MRFLIQAVDKASVVCDTGKSENISKGILIYFGVSRDDTEDYETRIDKFVDKLTRIKMFKSKEWNISASMEDIDGEMLLISNFTLYGEARKGVKVNFSQSAAFADAQKIYDYLEDTLRNNFPVVKSGEFGAMMEVSCINDGPINYVWDF